MEDRKVFHTMFDMPIGKKILRWLMPPAEQAWSYVCSRMRRYPTSIWLSLHLHPYHDNVLQIGQVHDLSLNDNSSLTNRHTLLVLLDGLFRSILTMQHPHLGAIYSSFCIEK